MCPSQRTPDGEHQIIQVALIREAISQHSSPLFDSIYLGYLKHFIAMLYFSQGERVGAEELISYLEPGANCVHLMAKKLPSRYFLASLDSLA